MATVNPRDPSRTLRGKIGDLVYSLQPNGTVTVREVGQRRAGPTPGEKTGQHRFKLGHPYVRSVLDNPELCAVYTAEAAQRRMRTCDLAMWDFLKDPFISALVARHYTGHAGDLLMVVTGDDFKVVQVGIVIRNAAGLRAEEGFAQPAQGCRAKLWVYTARDHLDPGQVVSVEATATDRCGHCTIATSTQAI